MGLRIVGSILEVGTGGEGGTNFYADVVPLRPIDHEGMHRLFDMSRPDPGKSYGLRLSYELTFL